MNQQTSMNDLLLKLQTDKEGFHKLSQLIKSLAGLNFPYNEKNTSLMACRLVSSIRQLGLSSYDEYFNYLIAGNKMAQQEFINQLTTNTTEFFRESRHFDILRNLLPALLKQKKEIRVWCAAASSGQEVYSILMTILENAPLGSGHEIKMLATDIDLEILKKASEGIYSAEEMKNIPPAFKQKYFLPSSKPGSTHMRVLPNIRQLVRFAPLNLISEKYPFQFSFDIIFCRNVLIYFERKVAALVIENLASSLSAEGYLFLGHSETGITKSTIVKSISEAVYQRKDKKAA